jgi:hypothetical protein
MSGAVNDLLTRASIKAGMLRMGEPIAFGSDADIIEELAEEVARFGTALEAIADKETEHPGDGDYSRGWMDGRWSLKRIACRALRTVADD